MFFDLCVYPHLCIFFSTNASLLAVLREGGRMMADGIITAGGLTRFAIQVCKWQ